MYAVIETGGKQYRVEQGQRIKVEKLNADEGAKVDLDKVLLVASHGRGKKIRIIKFRRRKHSRTTQGHRQAYTELEITGIKAG